MSTSRQSRTRSACPICGTATARCRAEGPAFVVCPDCSTHYRPTLLAIQPSEGWDEDYYRHAETLAMYAGRRDALEQIEAILASYAHRRGALLDVGCGPGVFLDVARQRGWEPHGVDPSQAALEVARTTLGESVDLRQGDLLEVDLQGGYAAVTMIDVLRHCARPREMLERARDILGAEGCILLREHNAAWTHRRRLRAGEEQILASEAVQEWSPGALRAILERVGFTDVRVIPSPVYLASELESRYWRLLKRAYYRVAVGTYATVDRIITRRVVALGRRR